MDFFSFVKRSASFSKLYCLLTACFLICCVTGGLSCHARKPNPPSVEWNFESSAITIRYEAAKNLNQYNNAAHTLILIVYQLSEAADFKNYTQTADGIKRLLNLYETEARKTIQLKNLEDLQRFIITPGTEKTLQIDRVKDARWVGLAAGYFNAAAEQCSAVHRIPIKKTEKGLIKKKVQVRPGELHIHIDLDANAMHTSRESS